MSGSMNRLSLVLYGIAAVLAVLTANGLLDLVFAGPPDGKSRGVFRKTGGSSSRLNGRVSLDDYITILPDRFCGQTRWRAPVKRGKGGLESVYVLRGIAIHSNPVLSRAFIEVPGVEGQQAYRTGDDVHGARLVRIENEHVELRKGTRTLTLKVSFEDERPVGFKAAAPGARVRSFEAVIAKMAPAARKVLNRATPRQRKQFMALPPAERTKALRRYLLKIQADSKKQKRAKKTP